MNPWDPWMKSGHQTSSNPWKRGSSAWERMIERKTSAQSPSVGTARTDECTKSDHNTKNCIGHSVAWSDDTSGTTDYSNQHYWQHIGRRSSPIMQKGSTDKTQTPDCMKQQFKHAFTEVSNSSSYQCLGKHCKFKSSIEGTGKNYITYRITRLDCE